MTIPQIVDVYPILSEEGVKIRLDENLPANLLLLFAATASKPIPSKLQTTIQAD